MAWSGLRSRVLGSDSYVFGTLNRYFEEDMMKKYLLGGASQNAAQWDGSRYIINHGELITLVKRRWLRDSLFRVESDGRIVQIGSDIIDRYFTILF